PTGAVFRRREDDDLWATVADRIRDYRLMQPRIRWLARVDLPQVAHVAGDEVAGARSRRSRHRAAWLRQRIHAPARRLHGAVGAPDDDLETPGPWTRERQLCDAAAVHVDASSPAVAADV